MRQSLVLFVCTRACREPLKSRLPIVLEMEVYRHDRDNCSNGRAYPREDQDGNWQSVARAAPKGIICLRHNDRYPIYCSLMKTEARGVENEKVNRDDVEPLRRRQDVMIDAAIRRSRVKTCPQR